MSNNARTFKVPAKTELEATFKVAKYYSVYHLFPEQPVDGEIMFEVSITAKPIPIPPCHHK